MALTMLVLLLELHLLMLWSATAAPATVAISSTPSVSVAVAKAGCQDKCGDITVPYPFGVADGDQSCYRKGFNLTCDHTSTPPKLLLQVSKLRNLSMEVLEISPQGQLRIYSNIKYGCYNRSGLVNSSDGSFGFRTLALPFTFSSSNRFTVIGCDAEASMTDYISITVGNNSGKIRSTLYSYGCTNYCDELKSIANGTCIERDGCCQIKIPEGLKTFDPTIDTISPNNPNDKFVDPNPCKYGFIAEYKWYNYFSVPDLLGYDFYTRNRGRVPVALDWAIEGYWCENASTTDPNYACRGNSQCFNSPNGWGYLCNCSQGYQGNPYLDDGCQDIDECTNPENHDCSLNGICTNTPGSYNCSCPPGMEGDGKRNGRGCIPLPPSRTKLVVIQVLIGVGLGVVLILASYWFYRVLKKKQMEKRKESYFKRNGGLLLHQQVSNKEGNVEKIKLFTAEELEKATDQYNENRILGQGGQGTVYKGMLLDGRIVAVKKSKIVDESQLEQFINEVVILSQINHRNVVKLLGCCLEVEIPLLVYEFISGGTLSYNIHHQSEDVPLSWNNRLRIATEVAGAIAYLHSAASIPIYHRDIKSSNILLDDKGRAKVSDFGTSRSTEIDKTHLTTIVQGTFGYLDPEYFQSSQFTDKSDVYSFGVVLVELLTGEKPISSTRQAEGKNLVTYFVSSMEENHLFDILDSHVIKEGRKEELQKIAHLAKRCLNLNGKERPTMKEVALELEGLRSVKGHSQIQPNIPEVEYIIDEPYGLWSGTSTSTGHRSLGNDISSQLEEKPLLPNSSS